MAHGFPTASGTLTERLESRATLSPTAVAVRSAERELSYAELLVEVDQFAARLRAAGVAHGVRVAVAAPRGWQQIVAVCAVLRAGGTYVPVDPQYPAARTANTLADSGAELLVATERGALAVRTVARSDRSRATPGAAYLLYTSGSTGAPKGVEVGDEQVCALLDSCFAVFDVGPADNWTLFHSLCFDFSVWELWGCLLSGGTLVVVDSETALEPELLADLVDAQEITVLSLVPTVFNLLAGRLVRTRRALASPRYVILGGEQINVEALNAAWASGAFPRCTMVNMYGITEATVHATYKHLALPIESHLEGTPIGRPLPHLSVRVVDEQLLDVPVGVPGEILLAGRSLAYGYWDRPDLTAERFPVLEGHRYYRTGDRASVDADGELHYLGRADSQVKVRGYRIELAEVESALLGHPWIAEVACTSESSTRGHDQLVAYAVLHDEARHRAASEIRRGVLEFTRRHLPAHEVPSRLQIIDAMPTAASGKVDRRALGRRPRTAR